MRENIDQLWLWGIILIGIRHELGSTNMHQECIGWCEPFCAKDLEMEPAQPIM